MTIDDCNYCPDDCPEGIQICPRKKNEWLTWAHEAFPLQRQVRILHVDSPDVNHYLGQTGTVIDYDRGAQDEWPAIIVRLANGSRDAFYGDDGEPEIELITD